MIWWQTGCSNLILKRACWEVRKSSYNSKDIAISWSKKIRLSKKSKKDLQLRIASLYIQYNIFIFCLYLLCELQKEQRLNVEFILITRTSRRNSQSIADISDLRLKVLVLKLVSVQPYIKEYFKVKKVDRRQFENVKNISKSKL